MGFFIRVSHTPELIEKAIQLCSTLYYEQTNVVPENISVNYDEEIILVEKMQFTFWDVIGE